MATKKTKPKTALVLRCCNSDMSSKNGFVWPGVGGIAIAADWKDDGECGSGLHGWLYGQGDHQTSDYWSYPDAKWLVVEVEFSEIRMLGGKCKFQSGRVVFVGEKSEAAEYIVTNETYASDVAVIGHIKQGGEMALVSVGALGTATAGDSGTATAGYSGTATAGDSGMATAGALGTICIKYWDLKNDRYRTVIGYIGEDGIKQDIAYKLDANHKFIKVTPEL
jgi:hypothetical protein